MARAVHVPPAETHARIDLFAAVLARIARREAAFGGNLGIAHPHAAAGDGDVLVLEHDLGVAAAPQRVERAQRLAHEPALDARVPERTEHHAVERPAPAK